MLKMMLVFALCLSVAAPAFAAPTLSKDLTLRAPAPPPAPTFKQLRRGRALLAVSAGLFLAGMGGIAASARPVSCPRDGDDATHHVGWGVAGGLLILTGAVLTAVGIVKVKRAGHREHPWSPALVPLALGTLVPAVGAWLLGGVGSWVNCHTT